MTTQSFITNPPQQLLDREFTRINRRYFNDSLVVDVCWELSPNEVIAGVSKPSRELIEGSIQYKAVERAIELGLKGDLDKAIVAIKPLALAGYKAALEAIIEFERKRHGDYMKWVQILNQHDREIRKYPPACVYKDIGKISIHPTIGSMGAPRYVLSYLIYHECLHMVITTEPGDPHPQEFIERDREFPKRAEARSWLRRNGFPVVTE